MKVLVIGGAGFIGSHVVEALTSRGHTVAVIDNLSTGKKINLDKKVTLYELDIRDSAIGDIIKKESPDAICHLAAATDVRVSVANPKNDIEHNILGLVNVLEACRANGVKRFIFSSTGGALYGNTNILPTPETHPTRPISPYGIDKLAGEHYLYYYSTVHKLPVTILRYSNVYGPRQDRKGEGGVVAVFIRKLSNGEEVIINGSGEQTRDFMYVEDVAYANVCSIENSKSTFDVYNISSGKETSVNSLYDHIKNALQSDAEATHGPELLGEVKRSFLDNTKAKKALGFVPKLELTAGISKTLAYFKNERVSKIKKKK